jgi:hypothetical protein
MVTTVHDGGATLEMCALPRRLRYAITFRVVKQSVIETRGVAKTKAPRLSDVGNEFVPQVDLVASVKAVAAEVRACAESE